MSTKLFFRLFSFKIKRFLYFLAIVNKRRSWHLFLDIFKQECWLELHLQLCMLVYKCSLARLWRDLHFYIFQCPTFFLHEIQATDSFLLRWEVSSTCFIITPFKLALLIKNALKCFLPGFVVFVLQVFSIIEAVQLIPEVRWRPYWVKHLARHLPHL